jgi:hypothetical protein
VWKPDPEKSSFFFSRFRMRASEKDAVRTFMNFQGAEVKDF